MRYNSIFNLIEYMVDLINKVNGLLKIIIHPLIFKQPSKKIHGFKLHYIINIIKNNDLLFIGLGLNRL